MKPTKPIYDPKTKETFLIDPESIDLSYVTIGAEGYVYCRMEDGSCGWRRRRKRWRAPKKRFKPILKPKKKRPE